MQNPFKTLLARKDLPAGYPVGTWVMSASPVVAEAVGCARFDWAVVDMEHTALDMMDVINLLQAIAGTPMLPMRKPRKQLWPLNTHRKAFAAWQA